MLRYISDADLVDYPDTVPIPGIDVVPSGSLWGSVDGGTPVAAVLSTLPDSYDTNNDRTCALPKKNKK